MNNSDIENKKLRVNRKAFPIQSKPHFKVIEPNLSLGYFVTSRATHWQVRLRAPNGAYATKNIGLCDDGTKRSTIENIERFIAQSNDGIHLAKMLKNEVLSYPQALMVALHLAGNVARASSKKAARHSVQEAIIGYQRYRTNLGRSERSIKKDGYVFDAHVTPNLGHIPIAELTREVLDEWMANLPGANSTVNRTRTSLVAVLNWVADNTRMNHRPWEGLARRVEIDEDDLSDQGYLETGEIAKWIKAAENPQIQALMRMLAMSGFRLGEVRNLKVKDVSFLESIIRVTSGKSGTRTAVMTHEVSVLIKSLIKNKKKDDFIFTHPDGGHWREESHHRYVERAAKKAGLDGNTIYDLRHSWITNIIKSGVDILTVSQQCGTSIKMIQKYYGKLALNKTKDILDGLKIKV